MEDFEVETVEKFYQFISNLTLNERGRYFEVFCLFYLKFNPRYEHMFEWVQLYEDVNPQLKEELGLSKEDKGTDILAKWKEPREEEYKNYVSIQCKFRTNNKHQFGKVVYL